MQSTVTQRDSCLVISFEGKLDSEADTLDTLLYQASVQSMNLVLDMSNVPLVSIACLWEIVVAMRICRSSQGDLRIVGLQPPVFALLEGWGFFQTPEPLLVFPSVDLAVASFCV
jgi:anti-anti-sigma factor